MAMLLFEFTATGEAPFFLRRFIAFATTSGILSPIKQGEQVFTIVRTYFLCAVRGD